jgi:mono/diheme cytochrome c family protein
LSTNQGTKLPVSFVPFLLLLGCDQGMRSQPRQGPLTASGFFADGLSARPPVEGTIARGQLQLDEVLYRGREGQALAATFPFPVTRAVLDRGRERYDVFCAPCHDRAGTGRGMIVERGYRAPPSLHVDRLRDAPPGHFFDVITRGFGAMPAHAAQVTVRDRWAITAYIRALQLSQHATLSEAPPGERRRLETRRP